MADVTKLLGYAISAPVSTDQIGAAKLTAYAVMGPVVNATEAGVVKMVAYVIQEQSAAVVSQQPRMFITT